jgi:hypothetical protein
MPLWAAAVGAVVLALGAGLLAMLGLSAGTAFSRDYHDLSPRQRTMAKLLAVASLLGAVAFATLATAMAIWALRLWLA